MKKKITIILSVVFVLVLGCAMLIGCTPSNPGDFLTKWTEKKNISYSATSETVDNALVFNKTTGKYEDAKYGGRTATETTYIKNENKFMKKVVEIYNIKNKDGKFSKNDSYKPREAVIIELAKDGKYNIYTYKLTPTKDEKTNSYIEKNVWTVEQKTKEEIEKDVNYIAFNSFFDKLVESAKTEAKDFSTKYEKGNGGVYTAKDKDMNGNSITCKVKSGNLVFEVTDKDGKVKGTSKYDMDNKIVIPSDATTALKELTKKK